MTHADLIKRLGGQAQVARLLGRNKSTLSRWSSNGIPPPAYPAVLKLAKKAGIKLTYKQLAAASPLWGKEGTASRRIDPDRVTEPVAS